MLKLFKREKRSKLSFADYTRRALRMRAPDGKLVQSEGAQDRYLEKRLATFTDDMKVELYAGDIRLALNAARESVKPHPDRFRIDFDWETGRLSATDGRAHFGLVDGSGLLQHAGYVLSRIRQDDLRAAASAPLPCPCGDPTHFIP